MTGIYLNSREILPFASELSGDTEASPSPSQSHLRGAISAAYYALFHDLIAAALIRTFGTDPDWQLEKNTVRRWYAHGEMRTVCQWVINSCQGKTVPKGIANLIHDVPTQLEEIAVTFIDLQSARHTADYDDEGSYTPMDADVFIRESRHATSLIPKLQGDRIFNNYLLLLLGGPKLAIRLAA